MTLAAAELAAGNADAAGVAAAEASRLDPNAARGFATEARAHALDPDSAEARTGQSRAVWVAAAACLADGDRDLLALDTLAMCYAWNGRFADAASAARRGVAAAEAKGDADWVLALKARLKLYEAGKPYRGGVGP
jgi:hypothetical protein